MDHVRFHPTCLEPPRQPEAVAAGFEGKRNPRDRAPSPDHLIPPAMQHCKQPFWARLELLARLTLNPGKHAGDEPTRLAHLEDGNDRAILVQGDEGPAQVVRLGHRGTPSRWNGSPSRKRRAEPRPLPPWTLIASRYSAPAQARRLVSGPKPAHRSRVGPRDAMGRA